MRIVQSWIANNGKRMVVAQFEKDEHLPKHYRRWAVYKRQTDDQNVMASEVARFKASYNTGGYVKAGTINTDVFNPARVCAGDTWAILLNPEPDENEYGRIEL